MWSETSFHWPDERMARTWCSAGVFQKVFRTGQSGGEVLWRKRSKARAAVGDRGLMRAPLWTVISALGPSAAQHTGWKWCAGAQEVFVDEKMKEGIYAGTYFKVSGLKRKTER